jgi:tetratricopeptide (TPR) repeat protein
MVVLLAETGRLGEALALGTPTLDKVRDLEEIDQQSYAALLLNVYLTLGSILLDLHRVAEANSHFATAQKIADDINQRAVSIGAGTESVRAMLALSQTQILQHDQRGLEQARLALSKARRLFEEAQNDYQREIVLRALEVVIGAEVEFDCQPQLDLIEELLGLSDMPSAVPLSQEETDTISRRLHLAGMAFAKLDIKDRALTCARKASELFDAASENRTAQQAAQRAVLYDGLSLRLEEAEQLAEATEKAEAACRILLPIFSASHEIYEEWMWKLTVHFRELAIKTNQFDHFTSFFKENLESLVTLPSENSSQFE